MVLALLGAYAWGIASPSLLALLDSCVGNAWSIKECPFRAASGNLELPFKLSLELPFKLPLELPLADFLELPLEPPLEL
jgi:hypothetical protein